MSLTLTLQLISTQIEIIEVVQLPKLRGNSACVRRVFSRCRCDCTQVHTFELVISKVQATKINQLPELRGNGAYKRIKS